MRYPLSSPNALHPDAIEAGCASLRSGQFTMGPAVARFEAAMAQRIGSKHAVMVNSGSSANLLAIEALMRPCYGEPKLQPGDEVLVPALSWSTTVFPLVQLGLVPVFVDSDPHTLAMDLGHAEEMLSGKTKALVLIHVLGCPADDDYESFCQKYGLVLIEDCCESMGALARDGVSVGRRGLMGTFSHFYSHQLTTMEGGTIVTDDDKVADDLRSMRSHGWTRPRSDKAQLEGAMDARFCFATTGYNVRPLEVQAAIGEVQLQHFDENLILRKLQAALTTSHLLDTQWLHPENWKPNHSWMNYRILVAKDAPMSRDAVMAHCESHGVETRPIIAGNLLRHPVMQRIHYRAAESYPVADAVMDRGFMIGCHPDPEGVVSAALRALAVAA